MRYILYSPCRGALTITYLLLGGRIVICHNAHLFVDFKGSWTWGGTVAKTVALLNQQQKGMGVLNYLTVHVVSQ